MRPCRALLLPLLALLVAPVLSACDGEPEDARPVIVVSIPPQAWLVERLAADRMRVVTLVEPGESPATYQPTDRQVSQVLGAEAYLRIGVPFENGPWLRAVSGHGHPLRVVDQREGVDLRFFGREEHVHDGHDHEGADPHIWLSPRALAVQAATVTRLLGEIDPDGVRHHEAALRQLEIDLRALDTEIDELLAPFRGRRLYVFHPSWGYFCDAYGLEQVALETEGKAPSESEITGLMRRARADGVRAIHVQPQIRAAAVEPVARALGVEVRTLDPLAPDVLANLRAAARTIARAWEAPR